MCCGLNLVQAQSLINAAYETARPIVSMQDFVWKKRAVSESGHILASVDNVVYILEVNVWAMRVYDQTSEFRHKFNGTEYIEEINVTDIDTTGTYERMKHLYIPRLILDYASIGCDSGDVFMDAQFIGKKITLQPV